jgi:hypothetical protein
MIRDSQDAGSVMDSFSADASPTDLSSGRDIMADELKILKGQAVAQAAELSAVRWQLESLLRQRPILDIATRAKQYLGRHLPWHVQKLGQLKRDIVGLVSALGRFRTKRTIDRQHIEFAPNVHLRTPVLIVDDSPSGDRITSGIDTRLLIRVKPGAGPTKGLPVPPDGEPPLRRPLSGSLIDWMVTDAALLQQVGTVVVDASDNVSLALLRGRLSAEQGLVLTNVERPMSPLVSELGAPDYQDRQKSVHARLPSAWLDPLDARGRLLERAADGRQWPKISVVMVSFNQASFLEEGLRSVLDQGYPNLEFLVVDGKSSDGSIAILERYRDQLSFLLIEEDKGQSDGLNKGFARATGDILTWVNSDDLLEPGALFRVAQAFAAYQVDMVVGGCRQIGLTRDKVIRNHHTKLPYGLPIALPLGLLLEMDRFWLTASFFYQPEVFFTRDIWNRCGGRLRIDLYYVLDYDLWVRMAAAGATIVHIPEFLACSRTHDQQKTTVGMPYLPEVQKLLREYSSRLAQPPVG